MNTDNSCKGIGGAPTRATTLPESAAERKAYPVVSGVLDYFPDAIVALAKLSKKGNDQHSPGKPLHWDRAKSGDEADALGRHLLSRGTFDTDGERHSAKLAWRALALLQKEIESERQPVTVYPRYWTLNAPGQYFHGYVYRATSAEDIGHTWQNGQWESLLGGSMLAHTIKHSDKFIPISAEEAEAKGAQV